MYFFIYITYSECIKLLGRRDNISLNATVVNRFYQSLLFSVYLIFNHFKKQWWGKGLNRVGRVKNKSSEITKSIKSCLHALRIAS